MIEIITKNKNKFISSTAIAVVGIAGITISNWWNNKEEEREANLPPETHDVVLFNDNTDIISSEGMYEVWVRAYDLNGHEFVNVNIKTDKRSNADFLFEDLNSIDGYDLESRDSPWGRWIYQFNGEYTNMRSNTNWYFSTISTTHYKCRDNSSVEGSGIIRKGTCTDTVEGLYMDYQNIFQYVMTSY